MIWRNKVDKLISLVKQAARNETESADSELKQTLDPLPQQRVHEMLDNIIVSYPAPVVEKPTPVSLVQEAQPILEEVPQQESPFKIPRPKNYFPLLEKNIPPTAESIHPETAITEEIHHPECKSKLPPWEHQDFGWEALGLFGPATVIRDCQAAPKETGIDFYPVHRPGKLDLSQHDSELNRIMQRSVQTSLNFNSSLHYFTTK